ncbi:hypothetical protein [Microbulbifer hainanensis]|uniref:hypothetical protein n=1 Tax=Microbulbifer hainanensis TaxID=2735675 RepID=UPI00186646A5|nr:hypothetical protein [Microbulbifer hainanensis]
MDLKIVAVIIGVVGALLGVYLREYIQSRNEKRKAIAVLRSNLFLFIEKVQSNEHLSKLVIAGSILDDRYLESLVSGDDSSYKDFLRKIESIEEKANTEEILSDDEVLSFCKKVKSLSVREVDLILDEIDRLREDVDHGTFIIGRSNIDKLDVKMIHRVLQVKRKVLDVLITAKLGLAGVYERENIEPTYIKTLMLGALKESVIACRHILPLMKMCNEELSR